MSPYGSGFAAGFRRAIAAPGELAMRMGFFAAILVVLAALWRAAAEARGRTLAGYDFRGLLWYVFAAQCAVAGVRARSSEEIGEEIGSGAVAIAMLRPVSAVGMRLAIEGGEAAARLIAAFATGTAICLLTSGPPPAWTALLLAIPAIVLGCAGNLAFQHLLGGVAFWLLDAKAGWFLYQKLVFLPGGMLLPLELLPASPAAVCRALPFAAMAYAPGRIAAGHFEPLILAGQITWLGVLTGAAFAVFAAGERRLQVVGG